ncbi:MAG: hypothetical protein ABEI52_05565 [Halobacteriaceae archaeon]
MAKSLCTTNPEMGNLCGKNTMKSVEFTVPASLPPAPIRRTKISDSGSDLDTAYSPTTSSNDSSLAFEEWNTVWEELLKQDAAIEADLMELDRKLQHLRGQRHIAELKEIAGLVADGSRPLAERSGPVRPAFSVPYRNRRERLGFGSSQKRQIEPG